MAEVGWFGACFHFSVGTGLKYCSLGGLDSRRISAGFYGRRLGVDFLLARRDGVAPICWHALI